MCRASSGKRKVRKTIARAQRELFRYHEATARFNAAICNTYPRQHRIATSMERHSSGLINDAPEEIQSFVGAAEDACYFCCPRKASTGVWNDGVAETIDSAPKRSIVSDAETAVSTPNGYENKRVRK